MSYTHGEVIRFKHPEMGNSSARYAGSLYTGELLLGTDAGQIIIKPEWVISEHDSYKSATETYMFLLERETPRDNEVSATEIVTSGNAFDALQVAYKLARPGKNDVLIITWVNHAGDKHELSTKVLANRVI